MNVGLRRFNLYLAATVVNVASLGLGCAMTWTSPSLPKLQDKTTSWLLIDDYQASWMTSLFSLGIVFGPFAGALLVDRIGRKWSLNIAVAINALSYILLILTPLTLLVGQIYLARFIAGFSGGIVYIAVPAYVGEVSDNIVRAPLGSLFGLFLVPGYLLDYCLGPWASHEVLATVSLVPCVLFLISMQFIPESPYYLIQKGKNEEALKSLMWFRDGVSENEVKKELSDIQVSIEEVIHESGTIKDLFATRGNRMGFLLSSCPAALQQLSGINVILFYGQTIFELTGAKFSSSISTIIIGFVIFFAAASAPPVAGFLGIRNCLIMSGAMMTFFQSVLGLYLYFHYLEFSLNGFDWLPITSLIGYIIFYALGFGPLPWAIMGEVFPANIKPIASCLTVCICYIVSFGLSRIFVLVNIYVDFMIFAIFSFIGFIFAIVLVPDTRGMSFQEIQDLLNKRK